LHGFIVNQSGGVLLDIDDWEVFSKVAQLGSLSKAAALLNRPISAVSRQISNLEKSVGRALFYRSGHGMELSGLGARILPRVEELLTNAHDMQGFVASQLDEEHQRISIGMISSVAPYIAAPLLTRMAEAYPRVRLNLVQSTNDHLGQMIAAGALDLAVMYRAPRHLSLTEEVLLTVQYGLLMHPGDPLAGHRTISFAALAGAKLVLPPAGDTPFNRAVSAAAADAGISLQVVAEVESIMLIKTLVLAGTCCAIVNPKAFEAEIRNGTVSCATIEEPRLMFELSLCHSREKALSEPIREGSRIIKSITREFRAVNDQESVS
jgi:LysR family transcriptional regulator, nitrogen assimilation regulatory protein